MGANIQKQTKNEKRKTENFVFSFAISLFAFRFAVLAVLLDVLCGDGFVGKDNEAFYYIA